MTKRVLDVLKAIGLSLNTKKIQSLRYNASANDSSLNFVEIDDEFVKVLNDTDYLRYLEKFICTSAIERVVIEFRSRKLVVWAVFVKYGAILLYHNLSLKLRLKYFVANIGPAISFGKPIIQMTKVQLQEMDRTQRKMMRFRLAYGQVLFYIAGFCQ